MNIETRGCNECGEEWVDGDETACIFCGSENTQILEGSWDDEQENNVNNTVFSPLPKEKICTCFTCGYFWPFGLDGTHSCATILSAKLKLANDEIVRLKEELSALNTSKQRGRDE